MTANNTTIEVGTKVMVLEFATFIMMYGVVVAVNGDESVVKFDLEMHVPTGVETAIDETKTVATSDMRIA